MTLLEKQIKEKNFQVVFAEKQMDEELINLDYTAEMSVYLCGLLRFGRNLDVSYSRVIQHKGYSQGFVLVARLKGSIAVGKVSVGIKNVNLFNKKEKIGYIFDMRIDIQYQRSGIGRLLFECIQKECQKYGCTGYVCSVNSNNVKSLNFFQKTHQFKVGSQRKIYSATSSSQTYVNSKQIQLLNKSKCKVEFFQKNSNEISFSSSQFDYAPLSNTEFSSCQRYKGMMRVKSQQSQAKMHIYFGDKAFGMGPQRIFLKIQDWQKWSYRFLVFIVLMLIPLGMILGSLNYSNNTISIPGLFWTGIGLAIFSLLLQLVFYKLLNMFKADYIRIFGYEFHGKQTEQQEIIGILIKQIKSYANLLGAASIRLNEDIRAPYLTFLKNMFTSFGNINTIFLYKLNSLKGDEKKFQIKNFFDPRDL